MAQWMTHSDMWGDAVLRAHQTQLEAQRDAKAHQTQDDAEEKALEAADGDTLQKSDCCRGPVSQLGPSPICGLCAGVCNAIELDTSIESDPYGDSILPTVEEDWDELWQDAYEAIQALPVPTNTTFPHVAERPDEDIVMMPDAWFVTYD